MVVIDDVTERHRLEAVRRDFVANISHELKTPVGAIGLLAETLLAEDDPEVADRLADRIQAEALRVGRTIEDLLELSRIEGVQRAVDDLVAVADVVARGRGAACARPPSSAASRSSSPSRRRLLSSRATAASSPRRSTTSSTTR